MKIGKVISILLAVGLISGSAYAATKTSAPSSKIFDINLLDGNQFNMYLSNYGKFAQSPEGNSGAWWPANRRLETYIFGAGIYVGALIKNSDGTVDTVISYGYNPNSGMSEMVPAHLLGDSTDYKTAEGDPYDRVHVYGKTNPPAGQYEWPLKTETGLDSVVSSRDGYVEFTDLDPAYQESGSKPIGIFFQMRTFQWTLSGLDKIVFQLYRIQNISGDTLDSVFVGLLYDNDVGNEAGSNANDLVGFIRAFDFPDDTLGPVYINTTYQYQTVPEPGWVGIDGQGMPGVVGSVLLETPLATDTVYITDTIGTHVIDTVYPGEQLGMTAMKIFTISIDPRTDEERYQMMAGYDLAEAGGKYNPYQDDIFGPGDKRYIQVAGPFTFYPGEIINFYAATLIGKDTVDIAYAARYAINMYYSGFFGPQQPARPNLKAWVGNHEVRLLWDDISETTRDAYADLALDPTSQAYNPAYREYDFEGYILRRSIDQIHWDTLGIWDLKDGITVVYTDSVILQDGTPMYTDSLVLGTDNGLTHCYVDKDLINGVTYYYELKAYDFNYGNYRVTATGDTIGILPMSLASAPAMVSVVPHTPPVNVVPPEVKVTEEGFTNAFKFDSILPLSIDTASLKPGVYRLGFINEGAVSENDMLSNPGYPVISCYVIDESTGDTILPVTPFEFTQTSATSTTQWIGRLPLQDIVFKGISILNPRLEIWVDIDNTYYVIDKELYAHATTDSTEWRFTDVSQYVWEPNEDSTKYRMNIIHRGLFYPTVYRIVWRHIGDSVTIEVWDTLRNIQIPFDSTLAFPADRHVSKGWALIAGVGAGTLRLRAINKFPSDATSGLQGYVYGLRLPGSGMMAFDTFGSVPADGEEWIISTESVVDYTRIPQTGEGYRIEVLGAKTTTDYTLDNVKVVPNPYYVLTPLDLSKEFRIGGIRFTNLPEECTIRIYTIAGDLIKVINVKPEDDGEVTWELLTEYGVRPASGVYIYHIETPDGKEKVGKFAVIF